jgi:hypothetical protein
MRTTGLSLLLLCLLAEALAAGAAVAAGEVYYFSAGYRVADTPAQNILQLGVVEPCADAWCLRILRYEGGRNLQRTRTAFRHRMAAPFRSGKCADEAVTLIQGEPEGPLRGTLRSLVTGWEFSGGGYRYRWGEDPGQADAYVLQAVDDPHHKGAPDQAVGYAYRSRSGKGQAIRADDVMHRFAGEIHHKNMRKAVSDDWEYMSSAIDFRKFTASADGIELSLTKEGLAEVVRSKGRELWAQHTLIVDRGADELSPVIHEYGHDFNRNGCFDEFGHNKMMLPVIGGNGLIAFVYIEYTPDNRDGVPMLSVGRYYFRNHK